MTASGWPRQATEAAPAPAPALLSPKAVVVAPRSLQSPLAPAPVRSGSGQWHRGHRAMSVHIRLPCVVKVECECTVSAL